MARAVPMLLALPFLLLSSVVPVSAGGANLKNLTKDLEKAVVTGLELKAADSGLKAVAKLLKLSEHAIDTQMSVRKAYCAFHAQQAAEYLARAGIEIAMAVRTCIPDQNVDVMGVERPADLLQFVESPCTIDVFEILGSLIWVAAYLSLVASECAAHTNINAVCAGGVQALVAALAQIGAAGGVLLDTCKVPPQAPPRDWVMPTRRLSGDVDNLAFTPELAGFDAKSGLAQEDQDLETSLCVVDAVQVASALGTFGITFDQTIVSCGAHNLVEDVHSLDLGHIFKNWCVVEVSYVLYSLFSASSFLASAVSHCGKSIGLRMGSECLAAVTRVIASVSGVPATGAVMNLACPGTKDTLHQLGPLAKPVLHLTALGRRLSDGPAEPSPADALSRGLRMIAQNTSDPAVARMHAIARGHALSEPRVFVV